MHNLYPARGPKLSLESAEELAQKKASRIDRLSQMLSACLASAWQICLSLLPHRLSLAWRCYRQMLSRVSHLLKQPNSREWFKLDCCYCFVVSEIAHYMNYIYARWWKRITSLTVHTKNSNYPPPPLSLKIWTKVQSYNNWITEIIKTFLSMLCGRRIYF